MLPFAPQVVPPRFPLQTICLSCTLHGRLFLSAGHLQFSTFRGPVYDSSNRICIVVLYVNVTKCDLRGLKHL